MDPLIWIFLAYFIWIFLAYCLLVGLTYFLYKRRQRLQQTPSIINNGPPQSAYDNQPHVIYNSNPYADGKPQPAYNSSP